MSWLDDAPSASQEEEAGKYSVSRRSSSGSDVVLTFTNFTGKLTVTSSGALINVFDSSSSDVHGTAPSPIEIAPARPSAPPLKRARKSDDAHAAPATRLSLTPSSAEASSAPAASSAAATLRIVTAVPSATAATAATTAPRARWAHSTTLIAPNRIMVYGGESEHPHGTLCDVHILDATACAKGGVARWEHPNCDGAPRAWHTATHVKSSVIVFGGQFVGLATGEPEYVADIQVFDPEINLWYPPRINGVGPSARSGHTATLLDGELVVFGGCRGRKWCGDLWALDTTRWRWRRPHVAGQPPSPRSYCSATAIANGCVFFGGNDRDNTFNDIVVLRISPSADGEGQWTWERPLAVGIPPGVRTGHSANALAASSLVVFGGWDPNVPPDDDCTSLLEDDAVIVYRDAFRLDTEAWAWSPVKVLPSTTELSKGIVGHRAAVLPGGGVHAAAAAGAAGVGAGAGAEASTIFCFGGQFLSSARSDEACFFELS